MTISIRCAEYYSSFKSGFTLEKSKSSPVPRRNISNTSAQVVSKWDVASNDSEMKTWLSFPSSLGLYKSLTKTNLKF